MTLKGWKGCRFPRTREWERDKCRWEMFTVRVIPGSKPIHPMERLRDWASETSQGRGKPCDRCIRINWTRRSHSHLQRPETSPPKPCNTGALFSGGKTSRGPDGDSGFKTRRWLTVCMLNRQTSQGLSTAPAPFSYLALKTLSSRLIPLQRSLRGSE